MATHESRAEIGRSISSVPTAYVRQLSAIQLKYNRLGQLKNLKPLLHSSLNKQDQAFLKTQDQEMNLPRTRVLDGELHLVSKDSMVKIIVLDLKQGKFEINNHIWQFSKPLQLQNDLIKIDQILKKARVLGIDNSSPSAAQQNAIAIYSFGFLATFQGDSRGTSTSQDSSASQRTSQTQ